MQHLEASSLAEVREEYKQYFEHITKHPRALVGVEVQSLSGNGKERLRDSNDARDWIEGVKQLLAEEIQARTEAKQGELQGAFATIHGSIDLFRNNADLVPGTKQFDKELADQFAQMASAYEERADGKLIGYNVPVQPIVNQLRSQLAAQRAAKAAPAAPAAQPTQQQQRAAEQPRTPTGQWDGPQAGISSKAGSSGAGQENVAAGIMDAFYRQNGIVI